MSDEKRIERKHFKEIRNNRKRRDEVAKELQEWREKACDREDVDCYPDQLNEFTGRIARDNGTVDRMPKVLMKEALGFRAEMLELDEQLMKKLDGYCDIYDTFPDLIEISTGKVKEHETAPKATDGPVELEESGEAESE